MEHTLTRRRRSILDLIKDSAVPLNANDVHGKSRGINLATVYRALSFLEKHQYITGFTIVCGAEGVVRYYSGAEPHTHFLHCEACHAFFPSPDCAVAASLPGLERQTYFTVRTHVLYFVGTCAECRKSRSP